MAGTDMDGKPQIIYNAPCYASSTLNKLQQQYQRGENCDLLVRVRGSVFVAHRCVFLAVMPKVGVKTIENGLYAVDIDTYSTPAIKALLDMMYSGELLCNPALIEQVQKAALGLGFEEAARGCKLYTSMNRTAQAETCQIDFTLGSNSGLFKVKQEPVMSLYNEDQLVNDALKNLIGPDGDLLRGEQHHSNLSLSNCIKMEVDEISELAAQQEIESQEKMFNSSSMSSFTGAWSSTSKLDTGSNGPPGTRQKKVVRLTRGKGNVLKFEKDEDVSHGRRSSRLLRKEKKSYKESDLRDTQEMSYEDNVNINKQSPQSLDEVICQSVKNALQLPAVSSYKTGNVNVKFNQNISKMNPNAAYPSTIIGTEIDVLVSSSEEEDDDDEEEEEGIPVYEYVAGNRLHSHNYSPSKKSASKGTQRNEEQTEGMLKVLPGSAVVPEGVRSKYTMPRIVEVKTEKPQKVKQKIYICHPPKPINK